MRNSKPKSILSVVTALFLNAVAFAQAPEVTASWTAAARPAGGDEVEIVLTAEIADGWHIYSLSAPYTATEIEFDASDGSYSLVGSPYAMSSPEKDKAGEDVYSGRESFGQKIRILADGGEIIVKGEVSWVACNDSYCSQREDAPFTIALTRDSLTKIWAAEPVNTNVSNSNDKVSSSNKEIITSNTPAESKSTASIWILILQAVLWGFAMLLTPCVFPMIPMTISFFMRGSSSPSAGRFKAFMYGLFIVLLYTVPISIIIALTRVIGGEAVTADIFNWLSTHWLPNIIFFVIFMLFAASFFGAFEIILPSSLVNKSDKNSDKKGLAGVFFMALTLVLVSFSCTGPIVGTVLIKSTQGEFWTPMVTMLAFSVAFALPFTFFALFPSVLSKLKSGSWLNSVKIVLGFIEIALGLKFLSIPDQTYHWHILDREVYLAIWIVVFTLLGLYLLGKIRFKGDGEVKEIGFTRLTLAIIDLAFVVYMIPGMWGAPLKALSGYLPPIQTQDFVIGRYAPAASEAAHDSGAAPEAVADLELPLGLKGYFSLDDGLEASRKEGKPLFVDITGHGCTNCREMEARVWSDERVLRMLREDFVITALYTDDKTKLPETEWVTDDAGKVFKDMGRVNSYIARSRFGVNAQPNYIILAGDGTVLSPVRGYSLDVDGFLKFLSDGLKAYGSYKQKSE